MAGTAAKAVACQRGGVHVSMLAGLELCLTWPGKQSVGAQGCMKACTGTGCGAEGMQGLSCKGSAFGGITGTGTQTVAWQFLEHMSSRQS